MTANGLFVAACALAALCGAALGILLSKKPEAEKAKAPTTKLVVWACLGNGFAWVWCSYALAYLGRAEIAESLSKVAITEIIGVVLVYSLKSLFENLSKFNQWPDKPTKKTRQDCD